MAYWLRSPASVVPAGTLIVKTVSLTDVLIPVTLNSMVNTASAPNLVFSCADSVVTVIGAVTCRRAGATVA